MDDEGLYGSGLPGSDLGISPVAVDEHTHMAARGEFRLRFRWDPAKAVANIGKRRVTYAQAASVLQDPLAVTVFDAEHSGFEERWFTLGLARNGSLLAVSHTYLTEGPDAAEVRILSARRATRNERQQYESGPR
jgi:uncharacterized DUF497 family protein